jgi:hypothetical protein
MIKISTMLHSCHTTYYLLPCQTDTLLEGNYMKLVVTVIGPGGLLLVVLHLFAVSEFQL